MFYSADILSAPRRGLGLVWLAATLGAKSAVRKISKQDIASCDIKQTCDSVKSPAEPMALRLSSQLLYGVVRIYVQQTELWMTEVQNTHASLRKALTSMVAPPLTAKGAVLPRDTIDMRGAATRDAVTLPINEAFYAGDFEYDWAAWEAGELEARPTAMGSAFATGMATPSTPREPERVKPRYTAEREEITLRAARLRELGRGTAEAEEEARAELALGIEEVPQGPVGLELEDQGELDLGLVEPAPPAVAALPGLEEELGRAPRPPSVSILGEPADLGAFDFEAAPDFGFDEGAGFDLGLEESPPSAPARRTPSPVAEDSGVELGVPARKKRKVTFSKEDPRLELSDEEMRNARSDYVNIMQQARAIEADRLRRKAEDEAARRMVFGPGAELGHAPALAGFWDVVVDGRVTELENFVRSLAVAPPAVIVPPAPPGPAEEEGFMPMDFDEYPMPEGEIPPLEEAPFAPPEEEESVGVGRGSAGSGDVGAQRAALPWNIAAEEARAAAEETKIETTREGEITLRSFVEGDISGLRVRRGSSAIAPESPLGVAEAVRRPPSVATEESGFPIEGESPDLTEASQAARDALENETANFFHYARRVDGDLGEEPLFFSDLAPIAEFDPSVAAQAFYHLLSLATSNLVTVEQTDAYGEILIELKV